MRTKCLVLALALVTAGLVQARTWTDSTGRRTIEADFVSLSGNIVTLRQSDGSAIRVPLARLSPADQQFAKQAAAGGGQATPAQTAPGAIPPSGTATPPGDAKAANGGTKSAGASPPAPSSAGTNPETERQIFLQEIYALRTDPSRAQIVTKYGGSKESEGAVDEGLAWLARHQGADGAWSSECLGIGRQSCCESQKNFCSGAGQPYEAAQTGLALLAFQAGGHYYFNDNKYSRNVRGGLDWLVQHQLPDGALLGSLSRKGSGRMSSYGRNFMYEHGIATFALAEACALAEASSRTPDQKYLAAAKKAVYFIQQQQHADGGWRYTMNSSEPSDTSVSGWQVLALKTARDAGIPVDERTLSGVKAYFATREDPNTGLTDYSSAHDQPISYATIGIGMFVHEFLLKEPAAPQVKKAADYLADAAERLAAAPAAGSVVMVPRQATAPRGGNYPTPGSAGGGMVMARVEPFRIDYYLWYNCTLALSQAGGKPWERWNALVRDSIIAAQEHGFRCERGSWPPTDKTGAAGGRICTTALAVLTLEVYYRYAKAAVRP